MKEFYFILFNIFRGINNYKQVYNQNTGVSATGAPVFTTSSTYPMTTYVNSRLRQLEESSTSTESTTTTSVTPESTTTPTAAPGPTTTPAPAPLPDL